MTWTSIELRADRIDRDSFRATLMEAGQEVLDGWADEVRVSFPSSAGLGSVVLDGAVIHHDPYWKSYDVLEVVVQRFRNLGIAPPRFVNANRPSSARLGLVMMDVATRLGLRINVDSSDTLSFQRSEPLEGDARPTDRRTTTV